MLVTCEIRGILERLNLQGFAQANASQRTPFLISHANRLIWRALQGIILMPQICPLFVAPVHASLSRTLQVPKAACTLPLVA